MAGTFRFRYANTNPIEKVLPGGTTGGNIQSTDVGKLCVGGSTVAGQVVLGEIPIGTTADLYKIKGIIHAVPTATTPGSTVPFYIQIIRPGDIIEANYSTTVERSTGASVIATSNLGYFLGIGGGTTTVLLGSYIDPSLASTAAGTTNCLFFKMLGFSTQNDMVWGTINSSHLANM